MRKTEMRRTESEDVGPFLAILGPHEPDAQIGVAEKIFLESKNFAQG